MKDCALSLVSRCRMFKEHTEVIIDDSNGGDQMMEHDMMGGPAK